jgi:cytochrome c oxidase subunit 2
MARKVVRIEIYVDGSEKPSQTATTPPFRLRFDTTHLADGPHTLRVLTVYEGGGREERHIPFEVDNVPDVLVEGLEDGDVVRGEVGLEVKVGDYELPVQRARRQSLLYVGALLVVLGVVWAIFALTPPAGQLIAAMSPGSTAAQTSEQGKAPVDKAFYDAGKKTFTQYCMSCHQANGEGVDDAFPPLAGNKNLEDLGLVVTTVRTGKTGHVVIEGKSFDSTMPPIGAGFSAKEIAEVATYIRNSWGNAFGGVTVDEVEKHLPGGSSGGS